MSVQYSLLDTLEQKHPMGVSEPAKVLPFISGQSTSYHDKLESIGKSPEGAEAIIEMACRLVDRKFSGYEEVITSPEQAKRYLKARIAHLEHEVFGIAFLNNKHFIIGFEIMFRGTVDSASVYPREVVKEALRYNCSAVLICHNHPSGDVEPSGSDIKLTSRLKHALDLVDVRVLDHLIVGSGEPYSMAENQLI